MTTRQLRALRGTTAALVATLVAATAHTLAGGGAPAPWLLIAVAALSSPLAVALAGRRLARWRVFAVVATSQLLFHGAFAITAGTDPGTMTAHAHGAHLDVGVDAVMAAPDPVMIAGHVIAAVLTALALFHGERMLRALGRGILRLLPALRSLPPAVAALPRTTPDALEPLVRHPFSSTLRRRGPPVFSL